MVGSYFLVLGALLSLLLWPTAFACEADEFQCDTDYCIPSNFVCNAFQDCRDGTDERDCPECGYNCNAVDCISLSQVCDGIRNCYDGTDEMNCPAKDADVTHLSATPAQ